MYFTFKAVLRSLLLPPASPLLLALLGAVLVWRGRASGRVLLTAAWVSLWLLATPIVADGITQLAEHYPPLDLSKPVAAQAIVIIGGGGYREFAPEYNGPQADWGLLERLDYGAFVARRTGLPILVSGAPREAAAMNITLARDFGAPPKWVDDQSRDTFEDARFTAQILAPAGIKRVVLITSSTHLWRAVHEFQSAGFDVLPAPVGVWAPREDGPFRYVPSPTGLLRSNLAVYELIGEPARRVQEALGLRERFDTRAVGTTR